MRKILVGLVFVSFYCSLTVCPGIAQEKTCDTQPKLRVVVLEGSAFERGVQHGKSLKKEIHELIRQWKADIEKTYETDASEFIKKFVSETEYDKAMRKYTPNLWEELKGMAKGAEVDFDTLYAFQLVDEFWCLGKEVAANHCTTFGVEKTDDMPSMIAQTLDIPMFHGYQTLLHVKDPETKLESFVLTFPGLVGANGMNSASVSICVNAVTQLAATRDGLPVAFVVRGVLEKQSYKEANDILHTITFGAPQNYLIGGKEKITAFECAGDKRIEWWPFEGARFTFHTNHPLVHTNVTVKYGDYLKSIDKTVESFEYPCPRLKWLRENYNDNAKRLDVDELKKIFSHRESNINNRSTFSCTIMVLSDTPELHITAGRPDDAAFQKFTFN